MCTVNRLFKHIIPNDGNDSYVTCCRTLRMPICYKAEAIGQSLIDGQEVHKVIFFFFEDVEKKVGLKSPKFHTPR